MPRETKIGLLVGLGVILIIGIIVSDHLSAVRKQDPASMIRFGPSAEDGLNSENKLRPQTDAGATIQATDPNTPKLPMPGEVEQVPAAQPAGTGTTPPDNGVTPLPPTTIKPGASVALAPATPAPAPLVVPGAQAPVTGSVIATKLVSGPPAAPTPAKPVVLAVHTVAKGDTLYNLAKTYYKDGSKWNLIQEANAAALGSKNHLKDGMKLSIPALKSDNDAAQVVNVSNNLAPIPAVHAPATASASTIEVKAGDTLGTLAARALGSKAKWKDLYAANRDQLKKEQDLKVGMILHVPATASASVDPAPAVKTAVVVPMNPPSSAANAPVLSLASTHSLAPTSPAAPAPIAPIEPAPASAAKAVASTYTVKPGDTLSTIASKTLGDSNKWKKIFAANKADMDSPRDLYAGQVLKIPAKV